MKKLLIGLLTTILGTVANAREQDLHINLIKIPSKISNTVCVEAYTLDYNQKVSAAITLTLKTKNKTVYRNMQTEVQNNPAADDVAKKIVCTTFTAAELPANSDGNIKATIKRKFGNDEPILDQINYIFTPTRDFHPFLPIHCGDSVLVTDAFRKVQAKTSEGNFILDDNKIYQRQDLEQKIDQYDGLKIGTQVLIKNTVEVHEVKVITEEGNFLLNGSDKIYQRSQLDKIICQTCKE